MLPLLLLLLAPPGIEHRSFEGNWNGQGPFAIQVLEVDPRHPAIDIVPVHARDGAPGRETVAEMSRRYGAAAAVNGGYFLYKPYNGAAAGNQMIDGQMLFSGASRSALIFCREEQDIERLAVGRVQFAGRLRSARFDVPVHGLNRPVQAAELVVFTSAAGATTMSGAASELRVSAGNRVIDVVQGGNAAIPPGGFVIAAGTGTPLPPVQPGDSLELHLEMRQERCPANDLLGAGPALIRNGRIAIDEDGFAHAPVRHPRTAVGIKQNGNLLFVTVDGRQPRSIGMTIAELARYLLELGAAEALNLDGGGSTTMVFDGRIVNRPSDPLGPRPVSDAVLIFSTADAAGYQGLRERLKEIPGASRILREAERAVRRSPR